MMSLAFAFGLYARTLPYTVGVGAFAGWSACVYCGERDSSFYVVLTTCGAVAGVTWPLWILPVAARAIWPLSGDDDDEE
jgi:hypothetical protein